MTLNKALLALALTGVLAACTVQHSRSVATQEHAVESKGLERRVERFSKPDKYGVMCYQDVYSDSNLSCIQVVEVSDGQEANR